MRRLCHHPDLADDLAQQVFLKAWKSIRQLRSPAAFYAWLKKIMISVWLQECWQQAFSLCHFWFSSAG